MSEQNKDHFEQQWTNAFEGASLKPSSHIWDKIELAVANADNTSTKKRLLFYKLLAAASISFAAVVAIWLVFNSFYDVQKAAPYLTDGKTPETINRNTVGEGLDDVCIDETEDVITARSNTPAPDECNPEIPEQKMMQPDASYYVEKSSNETLKNDRYNNRFGLSSDDGTAEKEEDDLFQEVNQLIRWEKLASLPALLDVDLLPKEVAPQMVPWLAYTPGNNKKSNTGANMLWTGLGMSTGTFNPNGTGLALFGNADDDAAAPASLEGFESQDGTFRTPTPMISDEESGSSFGVGFNLGTNISSKLVLISGVTYLQQSTSSRSNSVEPLGATARILSNANELNNASGVNVTNTYTISNTYRTLSIPVQTGYYLVNKRFNVLLLAGLTNDFFLKRNTSTDAGIAVDNDFSAEDSGYSLYSIGGLLGTQLSYQIGSHYSVAVQPQFRKSFNSFTPSGNKPSTLEVSFRLNYFIRQH